jgi:hypothetical protein
MRSYVRKIVMSGLVAAAALLGCAGPAFAGTGTTGPAGAVTAAAAGKTAETGFLKAIAARYPQGTAAGRIAAAYLGRLSARAAASMASSDVSAGTGISCASPTACLSVGVHEVNSSTSGSSMTPFAARLHAGAWKAVAVKTPKGAKIALPTGVSCKAATFCLVVGVALTSTAGPAPFALAWDGTTLRPVAAPPLPAHTVGEVTAVSCVAVNRCVAVGDGTNMNAGTDVQIIWTWNGAAWARTTVPDADPNVMTWFTGLHCLSVTSCILIGDGQATTGSSSAGTLLAASWNGTAFTDLHAPQPSGVGFAEFTGLSCVSAHRCAIVGDGYNGSSGNPSPAFAEVWNGSTWTITKWTGPKNDTIAELTGVSCTSAVRCIAVGAHGTPKSGTPAALGWNGSKWTVLKVAGPGSGKVAAFEAVSCPVNGRCVTTGVMGKADGSSGAAIAGYWNGRTWKYGPMLPAAA